MPSVSRDSIPPIRAEKEVSMTKIVSWLVNGWRVLEAQSLRQSHKCWR